MTTLLLTGCTLLPTPTASPDPQVFEEISALPGVVDVMPAPDEAWLSGSATVVVADDAGEDVVLQVARDAASLVEDAGWVGSLDLEREWLGLDDPGDPDVELPAMPAWRLSIFPDTERAEGDLRDLLALERLGTVGWSSVIDGWPSVTVLRLDDFLPVFDVARRMPLLEAGGTFSFGGEGRLGAVWTPHRATPELVEVAARLAADYPDAEVLVQAMMVEPQWPKLYVARLSPEQAPVVEQLLLDPELADVGVDGLPIPWQIGILSTDGTTYLEGNFGGVAG